MSSLPNLIFHFLRVIYHTANKRLKNHKEHAWHSNMSCRTKNMGMGTRHRCGKGRNSNQPQCISFVLRTVWDPIRFCNSKKMWCIVKKIIRSSLPFPKRITKK